MHSFDIDERQNSQYSPIRSFPAEEEDEITRYTAACPGGGASPLSLTPLRTLHSQKAAGESKRKDSV